MNNDDLWIQPWMEQIDNAHLGEAIVAAGLLGKNVVAAILVDPKTTAQSKRNKLCMAWNEAVEEDPDKMREIFEMSSFRQNVVSRTNDPPKRLVAAPV